MTATNTTILRELPDGTEIEIEVECSVSPGERQWFDALRGVGHPGSGPEVEVLSATLDGKPIELTDAEIASVEDDVADRADEIIEDAKADYGDYMYDRWKDERGER